MRVSRAPHSIKISKDAPVVQKSDDGDVLDNLRRGYNVESEVVVNGEPYSKDRTCFYVVVSQEGIKPVHAVMQIVVKMSSIAVFAFGTALFAASQLMSVSMVLMVLSLNIGAAFLGRVVGMFIAAEMNRYNEPILHAVVKMKEEAAAHVGAVLKIDGLILELEGHVIVNERVIARRTQWLCMSNYIGLLAKPFDIMTIATSAEKFSLHDSQRNAPLRLQSI